MKAALSQIPHAVRTYFNAVAVNDSETLANCFTVDGVVLDVDRTIVGRKKIRQWAEDEVLGGTYTVIETNSAGDKVSILLNFAPRDEEAFRAKYEFEMQDGKILTARLHTLN